MARISREITARPNDPEPRWRLGQVAVQAGMYTLASQSFMAALDIDPGYRPAREALTALQAEQQSQRDALRSPFSVPGSDPFVR
jgi:cytochrome c-type biogenesis protein CcmH/NrfG